MFSIYISLCNIFFSIFFYFEKKKNADSGYGLDNFKQIVSINFPNNGKFVTFYLMKHHLLNKIEIFANFRAKASDEK